MTDAPKGETEPETKTWMISTPAKNPRGNKDTLCIADIVSVKSRPLERIEKLVNPRFFNSGPTEGFLSPQAQRFELLSDLLFH
jgi:hypothetical protein